MKTILGYDKPSSFLMGLLESPSFGNFQPGQITVFTGCILPGKISARMQLCSNIAIQDHNVI